MFDVLLMYVLFSKCCSVICVAAYSRVKVKSHSFVEQSCVFFNSEVAHVVFDALLFGLRCDVCGIDVLVFVPCLCCAMFICGCLHFASSLFVCCFV